MQPDPISGLIHQYPDLSWVQDLARLESATKTRYPRLGSIAGRFFVIDACAGGMGEVYFGYDSIACRAVAAKTFRPAVLTDRRLADQLAAEVEIWMRIGKHPNIVQCFSLEHLDEQPFAFLEWVGGPHDDPVSTDACGRLDPVQDRVISASVKSSLGGLRPPRAPNLKELIAVGPLETAVALEVLTGILRGLAFAGEQVPGLVHADLKPSNVLVDTGMVARITDFGLARVAGGLVREADVTTPSAPSGLAGTPHYMAPEQWRSEPLDARTDLYAAGCLLYEMLTGRPPYTGNEVELQAQHLEAPVPALSRATIEAQDLDAILARSMAKAREDRFPSPLAMLESVEALYQRSLGKPPPRPRGECSLDARELSARANTYRLLGRFDAALRDVDDAIGLNPSLARAYLERGKLYRDMGRFDAALAELTHTIQIAPRFPDLIIDWQAIEESGAFVLRKPSGEVVADDDAEMWARIRSAAADPTLPFAHEARATTFQSMGLHTDALADIDQAIRLHSYIGNFHVTKASILSAMGRESEARAILEWLSQFGEAEPGLPGGYVGLQVHRRLGLAHERLQEFTTAVQFHSAALERQPEDALSYYNRAVSLESLGRVEDALADYTQAINLSPDWPIPYSNRGSLYARLRRYDEALEDYNRAIDLDPQTVKAYFNRSSVYHDQARFDLELADLDTAIAIDPNYAKAYVNRGMLHASSGRLEQALGDFTRAVEASPQDVLAHRNRGSALACLGRMEEAAAEYAETFRLDPDDSPVYWALVHIRATLAIASSSDGLSGPTGPALGQRMSAFGRSPQTAAEQADLMLGMLDRLRSRPWETWVEQGAVLRKAGRWAEALACYDRALALNPWLPAVWGNRGVVLRELGRTEEALASYERVLGMVPEDTRAWWHLGMSLGDLGRHHEALACYGRMLDLNPSDARAWYARGLTLRDGLLRYDDALSCFVRAHSLGLGEAAQDAEMCRKMLKA